jgi:ADP-heptose:LPS heptosyltransferase
MSPAPRQPGEAPPAAAKPKLLIVELWGMGDLVIATPFLQAASQRYAVTLLAKAYALDLQPRLWPEVNVVPFNAPWTAFKQKYYLWRWPLGEMLRLRNLFTAATFAYGLSGRWDPRDHVLLQFLGVPQRLGFPRLGSGIFLTQKLPRPDPMAHHYEYWRHAARALGFELPARTELHPPKRPGVNQVLIHTGARLPARVWPLEYYQTILHRLRESGYAVQVACDADQLAWWQAQGETGVVCPPTVQALVRVLDQARVFIGNCSGPGHLAAILGLPTFTIFGPSLPEWFAPLHPAAEWVEGEPCPYRPCSDYCRLARVECLENFPADRVWPRLQAFVAKHGLIPAHRPGLTKMTGQGAVC